MRRHGSVLLTLSNEGGGQSLQQEGAYKEGLSSQRNHGKC